LQLTTLWLPTRCNRPRCDLPQFQLMSASFDHDPIDHSHLWREQWKWTHIDSV